jgi:hypothetical protein
VGGTWNASLADNRDYLGFDPLIFPFFALFVPFCGYSFFAIFAFFRGYPCLCLILALRVLTPGSSCRRPALKVAKEMRGVSWFTPRVGAAAFKKSPGLRTRGAYS